MTRQTSAAYTIPSPFTRATGLTLTVCLTVVLALTACGDNDDSDQMANNLGRLFNNGQNNGNDNGNGDILSGGSGTDGPGTSGGGSTTSEPGTPSGPSGGGGTTTTPDGSTSGASCASACGMLDYCGILAELGATAGECTTYCADENPATSDLALITQASCDELWYAVFGDHEAEPAGGHGTTECYEYEGHEYCEEHTTPGEPGEGGSTGDDWTLDDVYAYCAEYPEDCEAYCAEYPEDCEALGL